MSKREMKKYKIMFYNRFANQTQTFFIQAESALKAVRLFYLKHSRKAYHPCIELIMEYAEPKFWTEEEILAQVEHRQSQVRRNGWKR